MLSLNYVSKKLKPKNLEIFSREHSTVTIPHPFFKRPMVHAPWEEFAGRIIITASYVGVPRHVLMLMHVPSKKGWHFDESNIGVDSILRYWSFLVQYMDKTKPLPNVPELESYGETTDGLGSWADWEEKRKQRGFRDPYDEWQFELKAHPELDEVNYAIEQEILAKRN